MKTLVAMAVLFSIATGAFTQITVDRGEKLRLYHSLPNWVHFRGEPNTLMIPAWFPHDGIEVDAPDGMNWIDVKIPNSRLEVISLSYDGFVTDKDGNQIPRKGLINFYPGGGTTRGGLEFVGMVGDTFVSNDGGMVITIGGNEGPRQAKKARKVAKPKGPKPKFPGPPPPWVPTFPWEPGYDPAKPFRPPKNGDPGFVQDPGGGKGTTAPPVAVGSGPVPAPSDGGLRGINITVLGSGGGITFAPGIPAGATYYAYLTQSTMTRDVYTWRTPPTPGVWHYDGTEKGTCWLLNVMVTPPGSITVTQATPWVWNWIIGPLP